MRDAEQIVALERQLSSLRLEAAQAIVEVVSRCAGDVAQMEKVSACLDSMAVEHVGARGRIAWLAAYLLREHIARLGQEE